MSARPSVSCVLYTDQASGTITLKALENIMLSLLKAVFQVVFILSTHTSACGVEDQSGPRAAQLTGPIVFPSTKFGHRAKMRPKNISVYLSLRKGTLKDVKMGSQGLLYSKYYPHNDRLTQNQ